VGSTARHRFPAYGESLVQRIAVAAHKGGSGKTTVTVNLAGALAAAGHRVVVIDADPQGAAGASLGVTVGKPTLYEVLTGDASLHDAVAATSTADVDLVPADLDLAGAEVELPRRTGWQSALRDALRGLRGYDVAIIDTAPGLGVLPYIALAAADRALVVCPPDFLSFRSLPTVLEAAQRARVALIGIVPNRVGGRTRHETDVLDELRAQHGPELLAEIPRRVVLQDAAIAGHPVSTYAPKSAAAAAFARLAHEVANAHTT
jgi:chromosome partitioning protein